MDYQLFFWCLAGIYFCSQWYRYSTPRTRLEAVRIHRSALESLPSKWWAVIMIPFIKVGILAGIGLILVPPYSSPGYVIAALWLLTFRDTFLCFHKEVLSEPTVDVVRYVDALCMAIIISGFVEYGYNFLISGT